MRPRRPAGALRALTLAALLLAAAPPLGAQRRQGVDISLPAPERRAVEGPSARAVGIVGDAQLRDLVQNGFPARLHFRVELWSDEGWVNDLKGTREWDVIVRYDPLDRSYRVYRVEGNRAPISVRAATYDEARELAERSTVVPIVPRRGGKYYYLAVLDVESLSLSDLDELERWLRGDLRGVIRRPQKTGTALTRGVRTLVARLLGGDRRHYEARSRGFSVR